MPAPGAVQQRGRWESWRNVEGSMTHVRAEQWQNAVGDVVTYVYWYFGPDRKSIRIEAMHCPAEIVKKYKCVPGAEEPHDEKSYSITLKIKKVEPVGKNFSVFVEIKNVGQRPVFLGVNGELPDGNPEFWVLAVEQQDEHGEWNPVDAVCAEHDAFDWITLKSQESVESSALAVDFPKPNSYFAKCRRKIGHLEGKIRAALCYYASVCEIEHPWDNKNPYLANSEPVDLPLPKN
jgi:hypothetical protein